MNQSDYMIQRYYLGFKIMHKFLYNRAKGATDHQFRHNLEQIVLKYEKYFTGNHVGSICLAVATDQNFKKQLEKQNYTGCINIMFDAIRARMGIKVARNKTEAELIVFMQGYDQKIRGMMPDADSGRGMLNLLAMGDQSSYLKMLDLGLVLLKNNVSIESNLKGYDLYYWVALQEGNTKWLQCVLKLVAHYPALYTQTVKTIFDIVYNLEGYFKEHLKEHAEFVLSLFSNEQLEVFLSDKRTWIMPYPKEAHSIFVGKLLSAYRKYSETFPEKARIPGSPLPDLWESMFPSTTEEVRGGIKRPAPF